MECGFLGEECMLAKLAKFLRRGVLAKLVEGVLHREWKDAQVLHGRGRAVSAGARLYLRRITIEFVCVFPENV
jgi:hypothetical protein